MQTYVTTYLLYWMFFAGVISRKNACERRSIVEKMPERTGTAFALLQCLRAHYGRNCEPFSSQNAPNCSIVHIQAHFFWGWIYLSPDRHKRLRGGGTQTPISAWLDCVAIVPVFRNDHSSAVFKMYEYTCLHYWMTTCIVDLGLQVFKVWHLLKC